MYSKNQKKGGNGPKTVLIIIGSIIGIFLLMTIILIALAASTLRSDTIPSSTGNVAVIPITGPIYSEGIQSTFSARSASSEKIVSFIEAAQKNPAIKAIVLDINSPGGTPVGSDMITKAVKEAKKPTYALIRDVGASGGYMIASGADEIIAYRMSMTGSIGVIGSYLEFSGLMDKYGVGYERLVAGEFKDSGSPFKELTEDERDIWQRQLDTLHELFIEEVAGNREMSVEQVRSLADGQVYLGVEALKLGLIDQVGGEQKLLEILKENLGEEPSYAVYRQKSTIFDALSGFNIQAMQNIGRGIGESLKESSTQPTILI